MRKFFTAALILAVCGHIVYSQSAPRNADVPKPVVDLAAGKWKYKTKTVQPDGTYFSTYSIAIKDDGSAWTVTGTWDTPDGPVTDVTTLEKGSLVLRKESFTHFPKRGQSWKPVAISLDFTGNKAAGTATDGAGQVKPIAVDLNGPVFADAGIGCLPLTEGYSTRFRTFNVIQKTAAVKQLRVIGTERVAVPAGTFESYKVELTSASGDPDKQTVWIARNLRMPARIYEVDALGGGTIVTSTELVP